MPPKNARRVPDWSWVGEERSGAETITQSEARRAAGLAPTPGAGPCPKPDARRSEGSPASSDDSIKVNVKRTNDSQCTLKRCRNAPRCYNHLGVEKWTEEGAKDRFIESKMGPEPELRDVEGGTQPAGLKNYGATCYANAFLQIWFNNVAFRNGVYAAVGESVTPLHHLANIFAMMQYSQRPVVDPGQLIEALRLNKGDQQDAAEFSKLFMSLLDDQFKRQESFRNFVDEQFSGSLEYRTECETCGYVSSTESAFLELEISLVDKTSLNSRIEHLLQPERLDGANKYRCPQCDSLQPATRSTHLKSLPPTLHFSLMQFVYDPYTGSRKKSRARIIYPHNLELNGKQYALRGIVTHHGTSALHGHFTAEVYNEQNGEWYTCSDDEVTTIPSTSQPSRKRIRLDPDCEEESSKDAYMLVYRQLPDEVSARPAPEGILKHIEEDNKAAVSAVQGRSDNHARYATLFDDISKSKLAVVDEIAGDGHVVPLTALTRWVQTDDPAVDWDYSSVTCSHGQIDPSAQGLRLVSDSAFARLQELHVGNVFLELDVCPQCVFEGYQTRSAQATRSGQVAEFHDLNQDVLFCNDPYILSKAWLKAWTTDKLENGTLPTDPEYTVFCEHARPKRNSANKVAQVTPGALALLQSAVGEFEVFKETDDLCPVCEEQEKLADEYSADWNLLVKHERQIAKHHRNVFHVFQVANYLLPRSFAETWNSYLLVPGPRPGKLDPELCEHGLLDIDPELDEATYLTEVGWRKLCATYAHHPDIGVSVQFESTKAPGKRYPVRNASVSSCEECRRKRLSSFDKMWLTIVNGLDAKPSATGRTTKSRTKQVQVEVSKTTTVHDIKCDVYEELRVTPKSQELYLNGKKLSDDESMESIGLLLGDHLNMVELEDVDDFEVNGLEGFGGSVLVGRKSCIACTYSNEPMAIACEMCETPLNDM